MVIQGRNIRLSLIHISRILDLTGQSLINYIGSYDYYLEKKDVVEAAFAARNSRTSAVSGSSQSPDLSLIHI